MRTAVLVVLLSLAGTAFATNVYENPMDGGAGGWGCDVNIITEGDRTFTRAENFNGDAGGWWYCNTYTGNVDVSQADRFEADVRWHQEGTNAYGNAYIAVRLGSPDAGEYFHDPIFLVGTLPPGSVGDEWYRVGFDMSLAAAAMDLTQFDGFEFFAFFDDDAPNADYVDMDNVVFTPEPASLLILGLAAVTMIRRR